MASRFDELVVTPAHCKGNGVPAYLFSSKTFGHMKLIISSRSFHSFFGQVI